MGDPSLEDLRWDYSQGSGDAFRRFFDRTKATVYGYLRRRLSDSSAVDDVFQETYLRVHRYVTTFDRDGNATGWLLKIAHRCLLDHVKKAVSTDELDEETAQVKPSAEDAALLREILSAKGGLLAPDEIELVVERFVNDDDYEDIASRRSWTPANARQRLSRALKKLRANAGSE